MNNKYKSIIPTLLILMIASCSTPNRFVVTNIGYEPAEIAESYIYNLPRTSIKVTLKFSHEVFVPGPYADYAQRLLGIKGVKKQREESYELLGAKVQGFIEPDPQMYYSVNTIEGSFEQGTLNRLIQNGLIIEPGFVFQNEIVQLSDAETPDLLYTDVTMESNTELRTETIYKTIITDTSFVKVPVTTEQMEMKTLGKKAEEAAKLILEIRSDRYYVSAGLIDPFPDSFDMKTSLEGLKQLEEDYLSLFVGKTYNEEFVKEFYYTPSGKNGNEIFEVGYFSSEKGLNAAEGREISVVLEPVGKSGSYRNLFPQVPEEQLENRIYYRIPELVDLFV
ncbi:MAG TPA: DUF4831 family protein, partial [Bacteroidales bacterium]|nr:DUF4831 family protein [Bacteroidales bacterium]